jgi:DMSO/TMAO reductase YedYZ heme-binding membrane subunit
MLDLHRFLGGMTVLFVALHLVALSFDSFVGFDWDDLFIPYASAWRPGAVALGIVALYLLLAVEVTSLLMRHLGRGLWHGIHLFSFAVFVAITLHALYAGADAQEPLVLGFAIASSTSVAALCIVRVALRRSRRGSVRPSTLPQPSPPDVVRSELHRAEAS